MYNIINIKTATTTIFTDAQLSACHKIIHPHAAAAAVSNAVPVPFLGIAVDTITMTTMAMALASYFGRDIPESVAKNMAIVAIRRQILNKPIKTAVKKLSKYIPFAGPVICGGISAAMLESAGWDMARDFARSSNSSINL